MLHGHQLGRIYRPAAGLKEMTTPHPTVYLRPCQHMRVYYNGLLMKSAFNIQPPMYPMQFGADHLTLSRSLLIRAPASRGFSRDDGFDRFDRGELDGES